MRQRGFAMILVIWALVLLSLVAAGFSRMVSVETDTASWLSDQVRLQAAANAAVHRAELGVGVRDEQLRWRADGQPRIFDWDGLQTQIVIRSENGKVDLNYAPREMLQRLIQHLGGNVDGSALADALIDWRDRDSNVSDQGAEALDYLSAGRSYVPANGPLTSVAELSQVMGFDAALVDTLRPFVTVYARRPKVEVHTAPAEVIAALPGVDELQARQFIEQRDIALAEDRPLDFTPLTQAQRYFDTRPGGGLFNIEVAVVLDGYRHREQAVVRLQSASGEFEVLSWETLAHDEADTQY